jgi:dienelactone hydrolase
MKPSLAARLALLAGLAVAQGTFAAESVAWVPDGLPEGPTNNPALCPGGFLTPEQGQAVLDAAVARFPDRASWDAYATHVRKRIQQRATLEPWPQRTALNPIVHSKRAYDGYTVENVAFESVPGYFVTGNLFRPLHPALPCPAILSTHGHSGGPIKAAEDYASQGRFLPGMQARCATLARMGAVVLSIDMVGYGDSIPQVGQDAHRAPFTETLQIWDAMRAVDFLLSLDGVDPKRIAVSGESGGGTQSFLLTALDPRVALSAPVVMVSSYFFGGCPCESGQPIHRSEDHFVNNAMIAALAAPRSLLVVSDGKDWTQHVPKSEFPFLQHIYGYYGARDRVANVHLADEGHDYGPSKRAALYRCVAKRLDLSLKPALNAAGEIDESRVTIEEPAALHVFDEAHPILNSALKDIAKVEKSLRALQK